jgi:hypothetical protein
MNFWFEFFDIHMNEKKKLAQTIHYVPNAISWKFLTFISFAT